MIYWRIVCLSLLCAVFSCKNQEKNGAQEMDKVLQKHLGDDYKKESMGTFAIYQSDLENGRIIFLVLNEETETMTYGPTKLNGRVSWHNESLVKVQETPEVIKDKLGQENFTYYINAVTGKKTTLNQK